MFSFLKSLFGREIPTPRVRGNESDLNSFVQYVATSLVDKPSAVTVSTVNKNGGLVINIKCKKNDIGKLIGKNGKTIESIRTLVNGAGGRIGKQVRVEIVE